MNPYRTAAILPIEEETRREPERASDFRWWFVPVLLVLVPMIVIHGLVTEDWP